MIRVHKSPSAPSRAALPFVALLVVGIAAACGVKGPPLPPVAATPERSDALESPRPSPAPSPLPASGTTGGTNGKKKTSKKRSGP
jgi:predicted small lipoprotein YifL